MPGNGNPNPGPPQGGPPGNPNPGPPGGGGPPGNPNPGPPGGETFYLNDMNGDFNDGLGYTATNGPDIFVYDFSTFDFEIQFYDIHNFDTTEDTLIFINSETPDKHPPLLFDFEIKDPGSYFDSEQSIDPEGNQVHNYQQVSAPSRPDDPNDHYYAQVLDSDTGNATFDRIYVYEDSGVTLASIDSLDYLDDSTDPTPSDTVAHVYEGDPFAVEGIA